MCADDQLRHGSQVIPAPLPRGHGRLIATGGMGFLVGVVF